MKDTNLLSTSIIVAAIVIAIALWKSPSEQESKRRTNEAVENMVSKLPSKEFIEKQVKRALSSSKLVEHRFSENGRALLLILENNTRLYEVLYLKNEYGVYIRQGDSWRGIIPPTVIL